MPLPLDNSSHFLYNKTFREQCQLVLDSEDHYDLFGLPKPANKREIAKTYLHLAHHFHPDHHQGEDQGRATHAMAKISAARELLDSPDTYSETDDFNINKSSIIGRFHAKMQELKKNSPPLANQEIPLSETTDLDLLCRVYWQQIDNDIDAGNTGMHRNLNADLINEIKSRIEAMSLGIFTVIYPRKIRQTLNILF